MSNSQEASFLQFQKVPIPVIRLQRGGRVIEANQAAKTLFLNTAPIKLESILSPKSLNDIHSCMKPSQSEEGQYNLILESREGSGIQGNTDTWQAVLYREQEDQFILIFMETRKAYKSLVKKTTQIENEKTELEGEYEEVKAMVGALRNLFKAFPQNTFQVDRFGRYTIIKDDLDLLFSKGRNTTGNFWEDLDESISDELWLLVKKSQKMGGVVDDELFLKRDEGEPQWLKVSSLYGKFYTFVSYTDISEEKRRIEKMVQEERLSTIGVLAGGLAHQYNNLHHALLGLIHEAQNVSGDKQKSALNSAASLLEKGATLSQGLLSHLRDSQKTIRSIGLSTLFDRVRLLVKDEMIKLNCRLEMVAEDERVLCNSTSLDQVLVNLILNGAHACYSTDQEGLIRVSTKRGDNGKIKIFVADNGGGIDKKHKKKLFTPLFSTKGVYAKRDSKLSQIKGTGLGLSLAKQLMEEQNGRLELVDTSSEGSIFSVTLMEGEVPDEEAIVKKKSQSSKHKTLKKYRIYVADDSPENRMIIKVYLKNLAAEILEKENGYLDVDEFREFKPEFVFVDWLMPEYSGNDFLKKINETEDLQPYLDRTFIFTGLDSSPEIEKWEDRVLGIIRKPVSQRKLIQKMGVLDE